MFISYVTRCLQYKLQEMPCLEIMLTMQSIWKIKFLFQINVHNIRGKFCKLKKCCNNRGFWLPLCSSISFALRLDLPASINAFDYLS